MCALAFLASLPQRSHHAHATAIPKPLYPHGMQRHPSASTPPETPAEAPTEAPVAQLKEEHVAADFANLLAALEQ